MRGPVRARGGHRYVRGIICRRPGVVLTPAKPIEKPGVPMGELTPAKPIKKPSVPMTELKPAQPVEQAEDKLVQTGDASVLGIAASMAASLSAILAGAAIKGRRK